MGKLFELEGNVLITGGSGFLGRGIMRRASAESWDAHFTVYSRDELKQHQARDRYPNVRYVLGDIRDTDRLELIFTGHETVIHAAALKYVPEAERNVAECVGINVGGTEAVLRAALRAGVKTLILISTDKAVEPANTYGITKALVERLGGEAAHYTKESHQTRIMSCRYGNVIGSTGSVVPIFRKQAQDTGTVTVTDPEMTRFWMSIDEAVDTILFAALDGQSGHIYVPSPRSMTLDSLLTAIVPDAKRAIIGLRPGEKRHEKLITRDESRFAYAVQRGDFDVDGMFVLPTVPFRSTNLAIGNAWEYSSENAFRIEPAEFQELATDAGSV